MDVKEIIESYLKAKGFEGLVNLNGECGCTVGDLQPCDGIQRECQPGYLQHHPLNRPDVDSYVDCEGGDECGCIGPNKPEAPPAGPDTVSSA